MCIQKGLVVYEIRRYTDVAVKEQTVLLPDKKLQASQLSWFGDTNSVKERILVGGKKLLALEMASC